MNKKVDMADGVADTRGMKTLIAAFVVCSASLAPAASIEDLSTWSLVEDPADANASGTIDSPSQATLTMVDNVPTGTDIGFQSVNGETVANSTAGYYFSSEESFSIAVDYSVTPAPFNSIVAIGFGIGEDRQGMDSAGVALVTRSGSFTRVTSAGRIDDINQLGGGFSAASQTGEGRFFVAYDATDQGLTMGFSPTQGVAVPSETLQLNGLATQWNNEPLLVSFFLRSQGLRSDQAEAVFSNFKVLSGSPIRVPEPTAAILAVCVCLLGGPVGGVSRRR